MNKKLLWLIIAAFIAANILAAIQVSRSYKSQEVDGTISSAETTTPPTTNFITPEVAPGSPVVTKEDVARIACPKPLSLDSWSTEIDDLSPAPINWQSKNVNFADKKIIEQSYREGINLAGHFHLATWSCGENCESAAIINAKNGQIIAFGPDDDLRSVGGWQFSPTSSLLIINPGSKDKDNPTIYSLVEEGGLRRICYLTQ